MTNDPVARVRAFLLVSLCVGSITAVPAWAVVYDDSALYPDHSQYSDAAWSNYCAPTSGSDLVYRFGLDFPSLVQGNPYPPPNPAADAGADSVIDELATLMSTSLVNGTTATNLAAGLEAYFNLHETTFYWSARVHVMQGPVIGFATLAALLGDINSVLTGGGGVILLLQWPLGPPAGYDLPDVLPGGEFVEASDNIGHAVAYVGFDDSPVPPTLLETFIHDPGNNGGTHLWAGDPGTTQSGLIYMTGISGLYPEMLVNGAPAALYGAVLLEQSTPPTPTPATPTPTPPASTGANPSSPDVVPDVGDPGDGFFPNVKTLPLTTSDTIIVPWSLHVDEAVTNVAGIIFRVHYDSNELDLLRTYGGPFFFSNTTPVGFGPPPPSIFPGTTAMTGMTLTPNVVVPLTSPGTTLPPSVTGAFSSFRTHVGWLSPMTATGSGTTLTATTPWTFATFSIHARHTSLTNANSDADFSVPSIWLIRHATTFQTGSFSVWRTTVPSLGTPTQRFFPTSFLSPSDLYLPISFSLSPESAHAAHLGLEHLGPTPTPATPTPATPTPATPTPATPTPATPTPATPTPATPTPATPTPATPTPATPTPATPTPTPCPDADGDLVCDAADNCTLVANPLQTDTDSDFCGNVCDYDVDNSCIVALFDIFTIVPWLGQVWPLVDLTLPIPSPISLFDVFAIVPHLGGVSGPSGTTPGTCLCP